MGIKEFSDLINLIDDRINFLTNDWEKTKKPSIYNKIKHWENIKDQIIKNNSIRDDLEKEFISENPGYVSLQKF